MTRLMVYITSLLVFTVSTAVLTASAELHQHALTIDATDRENWAYINLTKGETVDIPDPATSMAPAPLLNLSPQMWAALKLK